MDFVVAQLALIFLPGFIWANLDAKYVSGSKGTQYSLLLRTFLFGITTYGILFLLYGLTGYNFSYEGFADGANTFNVVAFIDEILWSLPLAFICAVVWMYFQNYRIFMRLLHWIGATNRFGDQDVWSFTLNSEQPHVEYVNIRNVELGFTYSGWVNSFSEHEEVREILLEDAYIYDNNGSEVQRVPHLYLSMDRKNLWIEFPYTENEEFYDDDKNDE
ncbi:MAG: hypothetical protein GKR98_02055 [Boseongicola sp.]|nr:MAG: hypothetical protein GKR98_02055 [Boseongicola sp.]